MKDFMLQNPRVPIALLFGVLGVVLGVVDFWSSAGVLASVSTMLAFFAVGITVLTFDLSELERNVAAGAFATAGFFFTIGSIGLRHPVFEECTVETQHTLERLGQQAHLNPGSYDLDAPQVQLAQNMYLACAVQGARNLVTVPNELFQAYQEPEISVATRLVNGASERPISRCLEAYNKLKAAKPRLFEPHEADLACLAEKPSRLSW